jgi:hypothetical protein
MTNANQTTNPTHRNDLAVETVSLLDQLEKLSTRVNAWTTPTVPDENREAYAVLEARLGVVGAEVDEICRAGAYALDNEAALTGCYSEQLLSANLPDLNSLSEDE